MSSGQGTDVRNSREKKEVLERKQDGTGSDSDMTGVAVVVGANEYAVEAVIALARRGLRIAAITEEAIENREFSELLDAGMVVEYRCSWTDVPGVRAAIDSAAAHFGRLDVLVNAVLEVDESEPWRVSEQEFTRHQQVNMKLPFFALQASVPHMRKGGKGRVINLSSIFSEFSDGSTNFLLGMAKAGVNSMTRQWAVDLCHERIVANSLWIGAEDDEFLPSAAKVAAFVSFLAVDATAFLNGTQIVVDGGVSALRQGTLLPALH